MEEIKLLKEPFFIADKIFSLNIFLSSLFLKLFLHFPKKNYITSQILLFIIVSFEALFIIIFVLMKTFFDKFSVVEIIIFSQMFLLFK